MLVTKKYIQDLCKDLQNIRKARINCAKNLVPESFVFDEAQTAQWNKTAVARHNTKYHTECAELDAKIKATKHMILTGITAYVRCVFTCSEDTAEDIIEDACRLRDTEMTYLDEDDYENINDLFMGIDELARLFNQIKYDSSIEANQKYVTG